MPFSEAPSPRTRCWRKRCLERTLVGCCTARAVVRYGSEWGSGGREGVAIRAEASVLAASTSRECGRDGERVLLVAPFEHPSIGKRPRWSVRKSCLAGSARCLPRGQTSREMLPLWAGEIVTVSNVKCARGVNTGGCPMVCELMHAVCHAPALWYRPRTGLETAQGQGSTRVLRSRACGECST